MTNNVSVFSTVLQTIQFLSFDSTDDDEDTSISETTSCLVVLVVVVIVVVVVVVVSGKREPLEDDEVDDESDEIFSNEDDGNTAVLSSEIDFFADNSCLGIFFCILVVFSSVDLSPPMFSLMIL